MTNLKENRNATWKANQPVFGEYLGIKYSGYLDDRPYACRFGPNGTFIFSIILAEPINVYGATRQRISISTNDDCTIYAA